MFNQVKGQVVPLGPQKSPSSVGLVCTFNGAGPDGSALHARKSLNKLSLSVSSRLMCSRIHKPSTKVAWWAACD